MYNNYYPYGKKKKSFDKLYPDNFINSEFKDKKPELKHFNLNMEDVSLLKEKLEYFQNILKKIDNDAENYSKRESKINQKKENIIFFVSVLLTILLWYLIFCVKLNQDLSVMLFLLLPPCWFIVSLIHVLIMKIVGVENYIFIDEKKEKYKNQLFEEYKEEYLYWKSIGDKYKQYVKAMDEYNYWQRKKQKNYWMQMDGRTFEIEVAKLFQLNKYETLLSPKGADGGVDIIVKKDNKKYAVQCKAHKNKISESVARDLHGVLYSDNFSGGFLISLSGFSSKTKEFCNSKTKKNIYMLELEDIIDIVNGDKKL